MSGPNDWRLGVKTEMRQAMIQEIMNVLTRTTKDQNEIREIAGKLELKSLQDAQNLSDYQNNVRSRAHQIAHPPAPISFAATITQPPPSLPMPVAPTMSMAQPGVTITQQSAAMSHTTHATQAQVKPEEEEYWQRLKEMQNYNKSLLSMISHVDTVISRGSGAQVQKIQEVRKSMLATMQVLRDSPTGAPTHGYGRTVALLTTIEKRIQAWMQSVVRQPQQAAASRPSPSIATPNAAAANNAQTAASAAASAARAAMATSTVVACDLVYFGILVQLSHVSSSFSAPGEAKPVSKPAAANSLASPPIPSSHAPSFVEATVAPEPTADGARKRRVHEFSVAEQAKKMREETEHFTKTENFVRFSKVKSGAAAGVGAVHYAMTSGSDDNQRPNVLFLTPPQDMPLAPDPRVSWLPQIAPRVEGSITVPPCISTSRSATHDYLDRLKSFCQSREALQQEIAQLSTSSNFASLKLRTSDTGAFVVNITLASRVYIPPLQVTLPLESASERATSAGGEGLSFRFGPEFSSCEFLQSIRRTFEEHLRLAPPGPYSLALLAETFCSAATDVQCTS